MILRQMGTISLTNAHSNTWNINKDKLFSYRVSVISLSATSGPKSYAHLYRVIAHDKMATF